MNPCPCGYLASAGDAAARLSAIARYRAASGPLLDRIDLHVEVGRVALDEIAATALPENSAAVAARVAEARALQRRRQARTNARLEGNELAKPLPGGARCARTAGARDAAARPVGACLSPGAAGLAHDRRSRWQCWRVRAEHVAEAIKLRQLDRQAMRALCGDVSG